MKTILKTFILLSVIILVLFLWQEIPNLSLSKRINEEKVSSFFTAISSLLTALTVYLLYKQIQEQIEDRKASSRPDLYPENQFFTLIHEGNFPKLIRDKKQDVLVGLINLHNIGLGAAKEIVLKWYFKKDILAPLVTPALVELYSNQPTKRDYSFVTPNSQIEVQLPLMYLASLSSFKNGWTQMVWEELFLEINYKDIHDFKCPTKKYKVVAYIGGLYASFNFISTGTISLSDKSTMVSRAIASQEEV